MMKLRTEKKRARGYARYIKRWLKRALGRHDRCSAPVLVIGRVF